MTGQCRTFPAAATTLRRGEEGGTVIKRIKGLFSRSPGDDKDIVVRRKKRTDAIRRLERYAEAAGLAQGGAQDAAREIVRRDLQERPKILVVGRGPDFSSRLVEYAVGYAKRMAYEIVAVNCAGLADRSPGRLGPSQEELFQEFRDQAAMGVKVLAARAAEEGLPFRHVVRPDSVGRAVRELEEDLGRVHFVLSAVDVTREIGVATSVPVFSLVE
jgi:hypothetical protein